MSAGPRITSKGGVGTASQRGGYDTGLARRQGSTSELQLLQPLDGLPLFGDNLSLPNQRH
jgi:hypothetical protein